MKLTVKVLDDQGNLTTETELSQTEVKYLLQYAINDLMAKGCLFNLAKQLVSEEDLRIEVPASQTMQ